MLLALEGIAGAGKSTLRDRLLADASAEHPLSHIGQFSWLSLSATRTLVRLRAGHPTHPEDAVQAACRDLALHSRFNLTPALAQGPVIADRFTLSTACLLALLHRRPVSAYVERLAAEERARPQLTVLLTTEPDLCHTRVTQRATGRRFTEQPTVAARLADLYLEAAAAWTKTTGLPVMHHPCATREDLTVLAATCTRDLWVGSGPTPPTTESNR
ncbi:hypothetical protein AB0J25_14090 [Streptomyces sp. NPDC049910]|uniref:hypothetical protein n=1 Tax=Streptomyces sp. NPDC049910 TaxID=3155278 RepID=UPI00341D78BC